MRKELKDYLHLYLGCEVGFTRNGFKQMATLFQLNVGAESIAWDAIVWNEKYGRSTVSLDEIKPILRPLSDITVEEKSEYCMIYFNEQFEMGEQKIFTHAKATKFLLSKHFDLFGLIEAGLAIDKTTLNQSL